MNEDEFQEEVAAWLTQSFASVKEEETLPESGNRVDFVAYTPFHSYVIEVEDSWESAYSGIGQAMMYAAETRHEPVVVFPADETDITEAEMIDELPEAPRIVML